MSGACNHSLTVTFFQTAILAPKITYCSTRFSYFSFICEKDFSCFPKFHTFSVPMTDFPPWLCNYNNNIDNNYNIDANKNVQNCSASFETTLFNISGSSNRCRPVPFNVRPGRRYIFYAKKVSAGRFVPVAIPDVAIKKTRKLVRKLTCKDCGRSHLILTGLKFLKFIQYSDKETDSWQQIRILGCNCLQNLPISLHEFALILLHPSFSMLHDKESEFWCNLAG